MPSWIDDVTADTITDPLLDELRDYVNKHNGALRLVITACINLDPDNDSLYEAKFLIEEDD